MKAVIWYLSGLVCLVIALIIFFRGLDIKALLFLLFILGAVFLFRQGLSESKKK